MISKIGGTCRNIQGPGGVVFGEFFLELNKRILLSAAISVGSSSQSLKHMLGCLLQETQC
jgi:hypothetical protein